MLSDEQHALAVNISKLPDKMLEVVVKIIKRKHGRLFSLPSETWASMPEIEMDMKSLTVGTQKELEWLGNCFWNVVTTWAR